MRDVPKVVGWEAGLGFCSLDPCVLGVPLEAQLTLALCS